MSSRFYHRKLTKEDEKPPCSLCNQLSLYYCTMNDEYYCANHVLGHDENEQSNNFLKDKDGGITWKNLIMI